MAATELSTAIKMAILAARRMGWAMKKESRVGLNRRALATSLILCMGVMPVYPVIAAQNSRPTKHWDVKYQAGAAPFPQESQIVAYIEGEILFLRPQKGPSFSITGGAITAVSSSAKGRYGAASVAEARFVESMLSPDANSCLGFYPCSLVVTTALLLVIPSYPIKSTEHMVHIVWREKGVDEEIVLKMHKNDYGPFLAQLEKATAKPWKNLDTEWKRVQQEIKREEPNKLEVRLEHKVRIAKVALEPGAYQIIFLEREASHGELYFFPGSQVNAEHLAAVVSVEIAPFANGLDAPQVEYKQDIYGMPTISSIRTQSKIFRFP